MIQWYFSLLFWALLFVPVNEDNLNSVLSETIEHKSATYLEISVFLQLATTSQQHNLFPIFMNERFVICNSSNKFWIIFLSVQYLCSNEGHLFEYVERNTKALELVYRYLKIAKRCKILQKKTVYIIVSFIFGKDELIKVGNYKNILFFNCTIKSEFTFSFACCWAGRGSAISITCAIPTLMLLLLSFFCNKRNIEINIQIQNSLIPN